MVHRAYAKFFMWDQFLHRMTAVLDAMPVATLNSELQLSDKLRYALLELRDTVASYVDTVFKDFEILVAASPAMRSYFERQTEPYGSAKAVVRPKVKPSGGSFLHLISLLCDEAERSMYGPSTLIDELQRRIDRSKEESSKLSDLVMAVFSDIALMSHTMHQIAMFFPWSAKLNELDKDYEPPKDPREVASFKVLTQILKKLPSLADSVMPFSEKLAYPVNKAVNESNIATMRAAEANLDQYWKIVDHHDGEDGRALHNLVLRHGAEIRNLRRTPSYSPQLDHKQDGKSKTQESGADDIAVQSHRFNSLALDSFPERPSLDSPRQKNKTRGIPRVTLEDENTTINLTQQTTTPHPGPEPAFQVSRRAIKVFKSLFFTPSASTSQATNGEISWSEFLHAMASAGCSIEKLQGSVWQFIPKDKDSFGWHGIHIHEPHPSNKIPFVVARRIGRRLNRNYGWSAKTFVARNSDEI